MLRKIVSISLPFFFNILALGAQKNCLFEMALWVPTTYQFRKVW